MNRNPTLSRSTTSTPSRHHRSHSRREPPRRFQSGQHPPHTDSFGQRNSWTPFTRWCLLNASGVGVVDSENGIQRPIKSALMRSLSFGVQPSWLTTVEGQQRTPMHEDHTGSAHLSGRTTTRRWLDFDVRDEVLEQLLKRAEPITRDPIARTGVRKGFQNEQLTAPEE